MAVGLATTGVALPKVPPPAGLRGRSPPAARKYASAWRWMTVLHPLWFAAGRTQADRLIAEPRFSDAAFATLTTFEVPLKLSALPWRPAVVHVAPMIVPTFPLPD